MSMTVFELMATLGLNTSEYERGLNDAENKAEGWGGKLVGMAKVATGAVVAATGAGATAIGGLTKSAVDSYAEYEQLAGGVETLFKNSSDIVMQYAENAYKTAGMTANDYMETVTGFSASLPQSPGGDTQLAAQYADMAVTDMSDNANKMGTSMESIQYAYQGFAKQNYTIELMSVA